MLVLKAPCRTPLRPRLPKNEIILGSIQHRAKCTGRWHNAPHCSRTFALRMGRASDPANGKWWRDRRYATSGDSGNDSRDKKMHRKFLESARIKMSIFRPDRAEGKFAPQGPFTVQVHGIFVLHGSEHETDRASTSGILPEIIGPAARVQCSIHRLGPEESEQLLLKVNHAVEIDLDLKGRLENGTAP